MKRILLLFALLIGLSSYLFAQKTYVPDNAFEQKLINLGYDTDGLNDSVLTANIAPVTTLSVYKSGWSDPAIADLTGIEGFSSLQDLNCYGNNLSSLDLSNNITLTKINCGGNQLTSLDLSSNTALIEISCSYNDISSLDLSSNTVLQKIYCYNNALTSLTFPNTSTLTTIDCKNNNLTALALTACPNITSLNCSNNSLTSLNLSSNTKLIGVFCENNKLTSINVTGVTALVRLQCNDNELETINVDNLPAFRDLECQNNKITSLNISSNPTLARIVFSNNPFLSSVSIKNTTNTDYPDVLDGTGCPELYCMELDAAMITRLNNTGKNNWTVDPQLGYSTNCQAECSWVISAPGQNFTAESGLGEIVVTAPSGSNCAWTATESCDWVTITDGASGIGRGSVKYTVDANTGIARSCEMTIAGETFTINQERYIPKTYIPDDNFEQALIDLTLDDILDDYVLTEAIDTLSFINLKDKNISDLTGIEDFIALTGLSIRNNSLTNIDLSSNTAITWLSCMENQLTALDLSQNTLLEVLYCNNNLLNSLDLSSNNGLTQLNCYQNNLTALDISTNTSLTHLNCGFNSISVLDVSNNTNLVQLVCSGNSLIDLDISNNPAIYHLLCPENKLSSLNLKNGNIGGFTTMQATGNPNLQCIQVDDTDAANAKTTWYKDATAGYAEDCAAMTYVPDDNFEQYLIDNAYDTELDNLVVTANIVAITYLHLGGYVISDLTGIEDFIALESLVCRDGNLTSLNMSSNLALKELYCNNNQISSLKIDLNTALNILNCENNQLTSLDISTNTTLTQLICSNNQISSLDISSHTLLTRLFCNNTNLSSLDVTNNTALEYLFCGNNSLATLDVSNNLALFNFYCDNNQLVSLDVSNNIALEYLKTDYNPITSIDISNNSLLKYFWCIGNELTTVDVSANAVLKTLDCRSNKIIELDISSNPVIQNVTCGGMEELTSLNLRNGNNAAITFMWAAGCPNLSCIQVDDPIASSGYPSWTKDATTTYNTDCRPQTYVPDNNFEQYLIDQGYDDIGVLDDYVPTEGIDTLTLLHIHNKSIADLTGIEDFIALKHLDCSDNSISLIDLSTLTLLEELNCSRNNLNDLDVSTNTALDTLDCSRNSIQSLDVSTNTALAYLDCGLNNISQLDVSTNTELINLQCYSTAISVLDVSTNTKLEYLKCNNTNIVRLDVSTCPSLKELYCNDIGEITYLNLKNTTLNYLRAYVNANLLCFEVDDPLDAAAKAAGGVIYEVDNYVHFSTNCVATYVPDDNFEAELANLGLDNHPWDDYVWKEDIDTLKVLNVKEKAINDLTGIEDFTALEELHVYENNLTALDVSSNLNLRILDCSEGNQIQALDLSNNTALEELSCGGNPLATLDLSKNINLIELRCGYNPLLQSLDLSSNTALEEIFCSSTAITLLDLTGLSKLQYVSCTQTPSLTQLILGAHPNLEKLYCYGNSLSSLDLSNTPKLDDFNCNNNQLISLDISQCPVLRYCYCRDNQLTELNAKNGNNANIINLWSTNNPNLFCIEVDDPAVAAGYTGWSKDSWSSYIADCSAVTYVPDDHFETKLIDLNLDDVLDNWVLTANIDTLKVLEFQGTHANEEIASLEGIQDFIALEKFRLVMAPNISTIDFSSNTKLKHLVLGFIQLTSLDISKNTDLEYLVIGYTTLASLDLSGNTNIDSLAILTTQLTSIDLSKQSNLSYFYSAENQFLSSLDFSSNTDLKTLIIQDPITSLNLDNNTNLEVLELKYTELTEFDIVNNTNLTSFYFGWSPSLTSLNLRNGNNALINDLNIENCINLSCITVDDITDAEAKTTAGDWKIDNWMSYSNDCRPMTYVPDDNFEQALIDLNLDDYGGLEDYVPTENIDTLKILNVYNESIDSLTGIEDFLALQELNCGDNSIEELDLSRNTALVKLICAGNNLSELDLSSNLALEYLKCPDNHISNLNISNNVALTYLQCSENDEYLTSLNVSNNTALQYLYCSYNKIASLDLSKNTELIEIKCNYNDMTTLKMGANSKLEYFKCTKNNLTTLDLSGLSALETFSCGKNQMISLDATACPNLKTFICHQNALTELNVKNGTNDQLYTFYAENNPDLFCIEVDDTSATYSANKSALIGYDWVKDDTAVYSESCMPDCYYSLSSTIDTIGPEPGRYSVDIIVNDSRCEWTALEASYWLDIYNGFSGTGSGTVSMIVQANTSSESRKYTLNIGGEYYTLVQLGTDCSYELSESTMETDYLGGEYSLGITTPTGCEWTAHAEFDWVNLTNATGAGSGNLGFSVAENPTTKTRTCRILLFDKVFTLVQTGNSAIKTYVPDDGFEQALIDLGFDDVLDDSVKTMAIDTLLSLDVSGYSIWEMTGIEDFISLKSLNCSNNNLIFTTLKPVCELPFIDSFAGNFNYAPQADVGVAIDTTLLEGTSFKAQLLQYLFEYQDNFKWFKDGVETTIIDILISIDSLSLADSGTYICHITNAIAPELTLASRPIHLSVKEVVVGIADQISIQLNIYPNPASERIKIETGLTHPVQLDILDIQGKTIHQAKEFYSSYVDVSSFAKGIYLVRVADHKNIVTKRIVVR